jgi:predicted kinase
MQLLRNLIGFLMAKWIWLIDPYAIERVTYCAYSRAKLGDCLWEKKMVMYVGYSMSGKTHHLESSPALRAYAVIETEAIHRDLNHEITFLQDDNTVFGSGYATRQILTEMIRLEVLRRICARGANVIIDSCNLKAKDRRLRLAIGKKYGYQASIFIVQIDESTLLRRLEAADQRLREAGEKPTWVALHTKQVGRYQHVETNEADSITYISGE